MVKKSSTVILIVSIFGQRQRRNVTKRWRNSRCLTSSFARKLGIKYGSCISLTVNFCQIFIFCTVIIYRFNHYSGIWGHRPFCCTVFKSLAPPPNTRKFDDVHLMWNFIFFTSRGSFIIHTSCLVVNKLSYAISLTVKCLITNAYGTTIMREQLF